MIKKIYRSDFNEVRIELRNNPCNGKEVSYGVMDSIVKSECIPQVNVLNSGALSFTRSIIVRFCSRIFIDTLYMMGCLVSNNS